MRLVLKLKAIMLIISCVGVSMQVNAQEPIRYVDDTQVRFNLLMPSLELELADGQTKTINIRAGLSLGFDGQKTESSTRYNVTLSPFANAQYRWYYNAKSRSNMGKLFAGNSANFLALVVEGSANDVSKNLDYTTAGFGIGWLWGLQRNYSSGLSIGLELGLGIGTNYLHNTDIIPMGGFRVGYLLYSTKEGRSQ